MINIKNFNSKFLKIYKKSYKNIGIYYIGYIAMKDIDDYVSICSLNPLHFIIETVDGYIEESNGNKYLIFASTDKNKKILTTYTELWDKIKNLIGKISDKSSEYKKRFTKIKFSSDDNLPLTKILRLYNLTIVVTSAFQEGKKYYPQAFLR